jgi:hypothetical protein
MQKKHRSNSLTNPFAIINLEAIREKERKKAERKEKKKQKELEAKLKALKGKQRPINHKKAFKVVFKDQPDLIYIAFKVNRAKATWDACKYFRDSLHLDFQRDKGYSAEMKQTITLRVPELDEYGEEGQVPIPILMKVLGIKFTCSHCHKQIFSYKDYEAGRCFIIEGEGDTNEFTKGRVLCYNCYKKIIDR